MRFRGAILTLLMLLSSAPTFSQGCAMCSSTAKATSKDGMRAIAKGVVVLLVPCLTVMTLGVWVAFRYGKRRDEEQAAMPNLPLQ
jgi:cbb3-type cytochrome oxidase subunit 3